MSVFARSLELETLPDVASIDDTLRAAVERATQGSAPPAFARALEHAVFPGGARLRPRLTLEVAQCAGNANRELARAAAAAIELLHCASLVHDDLPVFDDAPLRRGLPSVHAAFGEPTAVLVGDALIVLAFEVVGRAAVSDPARGVGVLLEITRGVGAPDGIVAGQAWELEPEVPLVHLHRSKTGALFGAATAAGAIAGGGDPARWRDVGQLLGEAYQAADDLADRDTDGIRLPNLARHAGRLAVRARVERLVKEAIDCIPAGPGRPRLAALAAAINPTPRQDLGTRS